MYGSRRGLWVRVSQIGLGWVLLNRACGIEPPRSTADRLAPTLDRGASTIAQHPPTTTTASKCCCYWLVLKVLLLVLARSQDRGSLSPPATIYWRGQEATAEQRKCSNHKATNQQDMQGWTRENHEHPFETRFMETTFHLQGPFFLTCNDAISLFFEPSKSHFYLLLIIIFHCTMCWSFSFTALALWEASTCKSKNKSTGFATVTWRKCVHCRIILTQDNFPQVETISSQGRNDPDKRTATN